MVTNSHTSNEENDSCLTTLIPTTVVGDANGRNLHNFFKDLSGFLWVSEKLRSLILLCVSKEKVLVDKTTIGFADLTCSANDKEIGEKLPENYIFRDANHFFAILATLIRDQWDGREGLLLNNGYVNIFYVRVGREVFTILVSRVIHSPEWECDFVSPDSNQWGPGPRVFSATIPQT